MLFSVCYALLSVLWSSKLYALLSVFHSFYCVTLYSECFAQCFVLCSERLLRFAQFVVLCAEYIALLRMLTVLCVVLSSDY
jgi:hypothetical protein